VVTQEKSKTITIIATKALKLVTQAWYEGYRHIWLEGGTWASKTYSVIQFLKELCEHTPVELRPLHVSVISETMPHLKRGAILDFKNIMGEDFSDSWWNATDFIYRWPETGSFMEFFSADYPSKAKGGRRDILFANEVNHIERDIFRQADMRTRIMTIADWNPESQFWFHEENLDEEPNSKYIHLTYKDALEVLPDVQREEIEKYQRLDPNWWNVYGLGITGKIEGLVHPDFEQVDELPAGKVFYGLDFGFSVDPTVLTKNVIVGDKLYSHEVFYDYSGLDNNQIAQKMTLCGLTGKDIIYADPSEPKSIEEIRKKGFDIREAVKGKGSVEFGIQRVNQFFQHWTKDSLKCIKEQRNYRYLKKIIEGREMFTEDTTHRWSHGMDSRRYSVASYNTGTRRIPSSNKYRF
jgi:phage terminase large subunit